MTVVKGSFFPKKDEKGQWRTLEMINQIDSSSVGG